MAYPAVTYTFTNGTTASATEVNQNFTYLINGLSDGTKDLSISALTVAGTASLNGAVNIGNATSDDIAVNGYITTALIPKTDDSYDLGTAALAWQDAYFDGAVYTDTISELTSAAGVRIDGVLLKDSGVNFGDETLSKYDESISQTYTITWAGGATATGTVNLCRVGRVVTATFSGLITTSATASGTATATAIASGFRPINQVVCTAVSYDNGTAQAGAGAMIIATTGVITLVKTLKNDGFTGGSSGVTGLDSCTFSWVSA
jgi:hypothetical protein